MQTDTVAGPARAVPSSTADERRGGRTFVRAAAALVALGLVVRLVLIILGWPETNSDEGYLGLMGMHIAFQGEHRIFYPGQNYMGPHQAVVGAVLFKVFGTSLFMLRLGLLLLFAAFLTSGYLFARLVYGPTFALFVVAALALGSPYVMAHELRAIGGYAETILFASLLLLLASRLVLTYRPYRLLREGRWRVAGYALWGFVAGTALWSDLLVAPFVLMTGLLLAAYCWGEIWRLINPLVATIGLVIGVYPLIHYNLHAAPGQDTLSVLKWLQGTPPQTLHEKLHALANTVRTSVPMMTGEPFCTVNELAAIGPTTDNSRACVLARETWGGGYMLLFGAAILLALWGLWWAWRNRRREDGGPLVFAGAPQQRLRKQGIQLALLVAAMISFYLYVSSYAALDWPGIHARYIIALLVATPAIFWPLWQGATAVAQRAGGLLRTVRVACGAALAAFLVFLAAGVVQAYRETPRVAAVNDRDQALIDTLRSRGVTHFYSDYWTCGKITFLAEEEPTCAVVNDQLGGGLNRYPQFWLRTTQDPKAAYVFADDREIVAHDGGAATVPVVEEQARKTGVRYDLLTIDGYVIYLVS